MKILLKDGSEGEIDPLWTKEWCEVYLKDDVLAEIEKARLWTLDNPGKRKTRRGLRSFLGGWIRRSCRLKPQIRMVSQEAEDKPKVSPEVRNGAIQRMKELLK